MKREDLKALGLTDDQIEAIMAEHGKAMVAEVDKSKASAATLADLQKQLDERTTKFETLTKKAAEQERTLAELTEANKKYEASALKARIAHETGIPYELAGRLTGEDEKSIRADAESLSKLITSKQPLAPLRSTESTGGDSNDNAYKALLSNIKGE